MDKLKAVYKKKVYEVRAIGWGVQWPTVQNGFITLAENETTTESEYLHLTLDDVKILRPVAKDKNGVMAYEGDIIKRTAFKDCSSEMFGEQYEEYLDLVMVGVLHFTVSKGAVIRNARVWKTDDPYESKKLEDKTINARFVQCHSEVIGNIYDNPEILKKDFTEE